MRSTRTAAAAAALLTLTLLAGCGGGGDNNASDNETVTETVSPTPSETTTTEATTPTESVSAMDPTASSDITQEQLDAALLAPEEVGTDFTLGTYTDTDDPPLCDPTGTPLDQQVPPQVQGGTEIDHSSGNAALLEEITIYPTEADAADAFTVGTSGLTCNKGTLADGSTIDISTPQDVTAQINSASGLGNSTAWTLTNDSIQAQLVVTLAGRILLTTSFQATSDFDTSTLPNPVDVAAQAFTKALAN